MPSAFPRTDAALARDREPRYGLFLGVPILAACAGLLVLCLPLHERHLQVPAMLVGEADTPQLATRLPQELISGAQLPPCWVLARARDGHVRRLPLQAVERSPETGRLVFAPAPGTEVDGLTLLPTIEVAGGRQSLLAAIVEPGL